ncbi:23076_t:CDS:2 [Racocetra persica]|uniref:23076_t:CDS:1 n=1 Tax=Racocetra persica TaxID=160502 RepID=A0ACA9P5A0_9GLOM|nr:23076_t:CDS:2 [Racocetra persica]
MIIDIEEPDKVNLNDYPEFRLVGGEYVVDLKNIKYNHTWNENVGDITYRIYQDPNGKKVIKKVGEESVPKKFPDQQEANKLAEFCDLLSSAKTEQEINEVKDRVLADIEIKRNAKKGKRKREDEKGEDIHDNNKKPKLDDEDKKNYEGFLKNGILNEVEDNKLKSGLEVAIRLEGEKEYDDEKTRKEIEEDTIVTSLKERLKDNNISDDELSAEVKKLINNEITDEEQAKSFLEEAKKNITEKLKKDLKIIQEQIKSLSSENNSYLASFYSSNKGQVETLEKSISAVLNQNQTGSEPKEAVSYGSNALMIYLGAPQNTRRRPLTELKIPEFRQILAENNINIDNVIVHGPYVTNLANPDRTEIFHWSVEFLKKEVTRMEAIGLKTLILHPGSAVDAPINDSLSQVAHGINLILQKSIQARIVLETMCGRGSEVGINFEQLKYIIDRVEQKERVGVC